MKTESFSTPKDINFNKSWITGDKNQHGNLQRSLNYQPKCWHRVMASALSNSYDSFISNARWIYVA